MKFGILSETPTSLHIELPRSLPTKHASEVIDLLQDVLPEVAKALVLNNQLMECAQENWQIAKILNQSKLGWAAFFYRNCHRRRLLALYKNQQGLLY